MIYSKADNQDFALKLLLGAALDLHQDISLRKYEFGDRVSAKKVLAIIKLLEDK